MEESKEAMKDTGKVEIVKGDRGNGGTRRTRSDRGRLKIWQLVVVLIVVVCGGALFISAVAGLMGDGKVTLDSGNYADVSDFAEIETVDDYNELVKGSVSAILYIDKVDGEDADKMRKGVIRYMLDRDTMVYRIMLTEAREAGLYKNGEDYPAVVLMAHGEPKIWLRGDGSNRGSYESEEALGQWLDAHIEERAQ